MRNWHTKNIVASVCLLLFLFILLSVGLSFGLRHLVLRQCTDNEDISTTNISQKTTENEDINQYLDLTEDEFLAVFNLPPVEDPEENERRAEVLKQHQQEVREHNEAYLAGERTWYEGINEFSDIPDHEFIATHTGLIDDPEEQERENETQSVLDESVMSSLPASYDSVSLQYVSPVKNQGECGSSVAFATVALLETCFKKTVGEFGDYSEQHLLDCAYENRGIYDNFCSDGDETVS